MNNGEALSKKWKKVEESAIKLLVESLMQRRAVTRNKPTKSWLRSKIWVRELPLLMTKRIRFSKSVTK